ncbi:MAG: iron ABC transporter permease [candidate division NC10 bacterium]|nr:iron ABC transporter permease [candidate division NC10 bacterium]
MAKRIVLSSVFAVLVVAGLLPVLAMGVKSIILDGRFSLENYKALLTLGRAQTLISHSVALSLLTTFFATIIGLPLGILLGKTDLPFGKLLIVLFAIPLLIPPYITAISWFYILGREGVIGRLLGPSLAELTSKWLFGLPGCVLILFSTFLPIVILLTVTYLKTINPRLEEAGRLVSDWPGVLRSITIPLILPGVLLAVMLVFLLSLGEFSVPSFLRYNVFPVESFTQFSAFLNFSAATVAAIPLAIVTFFVLALESHFLREKTYQVRPAHGTSFTERIQLGRNRNWLFAVSALLCFVIVILPSLVLIVQSLSVNAYSLAIAKAGDSLIRSLIYAAVGASVLTVIGFLSGYLVQTRALPFWQTTDSLTIFLFALPSTVIGIGLISLWNRPWTNFIYATPVIIIIGYIAQYAAISSRITVSMLTQIPPSMEEAAQVAGAGWFRRMALIVAPLAKRGLIAAWLVGFIFCVRDTGISMIVYPPGLDTLPVRTFTLMANAPAGLTSALCVIMICAALVPVGILTAAFKTRML